MRELYRRLRRIGGELLDTMNLRLATSADALGAASVVKEVFEEFGFTWEPEGYHADLHDLDQGYFAHGNLFWVAEEGGEIVGTVALELFPRNEGLAGDTVEIEGLVRAAGADCSLERLYVRPSVRRRGLGRRLARTVIDEASARGRTLMELWSDKRFEDAHRLYLAMGARIIGERICPDPDQSAEWGLILPLA